MNWIRKALIVVALFSLPALPYFFMGPGQKYDLTRLERIGSPARSEP
jgi:hypothetical protein